MITEVKFVQGPNEIGCVHLDGAVEPSVSENAAMVLFVGEGGHKFFVPLNRLVSVEIFKPKDNVVPLHEAGEAPVVN